MKLRSALVLCLFAWACGQGEEPERVVEPADTALQIAQQEEPPSEPPRRPFLPDEMRRSTRPESFPHEAHREIDCAVCHDEPQGHATHEGISCAACHEASADVRVMALEPRDCQSCHHRADQPRPCEACHESRPALLSVQQRLDLSVWSAPRTRSFDFDHSLHADLSCGACHRARPALLPAESCGSCHAEHHTAEARCVTCHVEPPSGAHDVRVHLTCSGSGCHRAPDVEAIADSRNVCLVCHRQQQDHEPGGNCVECHRVRGDPVTWAPARDSGLPGHAPGRAP